MHGPQVLPGGEWLLFTIVTGAPAIATVDTWDKAQIVVQSLKSSERRTLVSGGSDGRYLPTGHLVYALAGVLFAVPFDLSTSRARHLDRSSSSRASERSLASSSRSGVAQFSISRTRVLVFVPGPASTSLSGAQRSLALVDRTGKVQPLELPPQPYVHPRLSRDGTQLVVGTDDGKEANVWVCALQPACVPRQLTFKGANRFPIWSSDGRYIAFQSDRDGLAAIYRQLADGSGSVEALTKPGSEQRDEPESWSPDGRSLTLSRWQGAHESIWMMSPDGDRTPKPLVDEGRATQKHSVFAKNGWFAYMSNHLTGVTQVHVQSPTGTKYKVTNDVGRTPLWSPDGKELFYHTGPTNRLMVVDVLGTDGGFRVGKPTALPIEGTEHQRSQRNYDITPDGKQLLVVVPAASSEPDSDFRPAQQEIRIVLNWFEELKTKVPTK